jgi:RNA polymerase sigma factor (sigma-70 family)
MDQLLRPYLEATDESERQERLDELILLHAAPVIRKVLRFKLGFHLSNEGTNRDNHEAEDLYHETLSKIVQRLNDLRSSSRQAGIKNFRHYVSGIAVNVCVDFLRARSPAKYRLKHNIRDIFSRHQDFAAWKVNDEVVGGFAVWRDTGKTPASTRQVHELENNLDAFRLSTFSKEDIHQVPVIKIVAEILQWMDRPILIDDLTGIVSVLLQVDDRSKVAITFDETVITESAAMEDRPTAESMVAAKELLDHVWQIVQRMPGQERDTYCFSFEDAAGADLFSLLLETGIARLSQIAQAFGRSVSEINRLRSLMPMDYVAIAMELQTSRSRVTKLRYQAVQRLRKEMGLGIRRK